MADSVSNLFKKLFSQDEEERGFSEAEIIKAEQKLGIQLPTTLRHLYLNQIRNTLINSYHNFARPEQLYIDNGKWLLFYGENQGIWASAINLHEKTEQQLKVYINYEQQRYEEEAKSFKDFLILRAACDYGHYIYPYRMYAGSVPEKDLVA